MQLTPFFKRPSSVFIKKPISLFQDRSDITAISKAPTTITPVSPSNKQQEGAFSQAIQISSTSTDNEFMSRLNAKQAAKIVEELPPSEYEYGRLIGSGMIGIVYMARIAKNPTLGYFCIKRMLGELMVSKGLIESVKTEIRILDEVKTIPGCIKLCDVI